MRNPKPRGRAVQSAAPVARLRTLYIAVAVVALLIVGGVAYNLYGKSSTTATAVAIATIPPVRGADIPLGKTDDGRYFLGKADAPITVVEYADFQCPGCAFYSNNLSAGFEKDYVQTGQVRLIYQDFPLPMHSNSVYSAIAARCAGEQSTSAFWQYHDLLFTNQAQWRELATAELKTQQIAYAKQMGLDDVAFGACIELPESERTVRDFQKKSNALGLPGTPSFAIQGTVMDASSAKSIDDIDALVRAAVEAQLKK